jgi:hypothetical protein
MKFFNSKLNFNILQMTCLFSIVSFASFATLAQVKVRGAFNVNVNVTGEGPYLLACDSNKYILYTGDNYKILLFDKHGIFIDSVVVGESISNIEFGCNKSLFAMNHMENMLYEIGFSPLRIINKFKIGKPEDYYKYLCPIYDSLFEAVNFLPSYYLDTSNINMKYEFNTHYCYKLNLFIEKESVFQFYNNCIYKVFCKGNIIESKNLNKEFFFSKEINYNSQLFTIDEVKASCVYISGNEVIFEDLKKNILKKYIIEQVISPVICKKIDAQEIVYYKEKKGDILKFEIIYW